MQAKGNQQTLEAWLKKNFTHKEDAPYLLWTGVAWMARAGLMAGDDEEGPAFVAELYVGVAIVERAVALDPSVDHYTGLMALASYHARSNMAELDEAKKLLDTAMEKTQRRSAPRSLHVRRALRVRQGRRGPLPEHAQQGRPGSGSGSRRSSPERHRQAGGEAMAGEAPRQGPVRHRARGQRLEQPGIGSEPRSGSRYPRARGARPRPRLRPRRSRPNRRSRSTPTSRPPWRSPRVPRPIERGPLAHPPNDFAIAT